MDSLYEKNIAELKQIATQLNIKNCSYMNKSTLVVLINNKQNGSDCGTDCGAGAYVDAAVVGTAVVKGF